MDRRDRQGRSSTAASLFILITLVVTALFAFSAAATGGSEGSASAPADFERLSGLIDNELYKITVDMRLRTELAEIDGLDQSQAMTLRTRLGLGTKPYHGFSGFAEIANVVSFCSSCYFDAVETPTGETVIADPELTRFNRGFIKYENEGENSLQVIAGRQRIILDDARFIGNVGWRQHEQTFDSVYASSSLGIPGLQIRYGFLWDVNRIFGDKGGNPARQNFDSDSHFVNIAYQFEGGPEVVVFSYLLDLSNDHVSSAIASSNTFGTRLSGTHAFDDQWTLAYSGSYGYQTDGSDNPLDYGAHYVWLSTMLKWKPVGGIGLGFEMLGSDGGLARFVTPLATAHKFNGFADVWLDNGGSDGLQDLFVTVAPKLPLGLKGKIVYHHFWSEDRAHDLGNEIDGVVSKQLGRGVSVAAKGAYYISSTSSRAIGKKDTWRYIFQVSFKH